MKRWDGAFIVFAKEMKDILRDRRTIISMVLIPILFYPLLSMGLGSVISMQIAKTQAESQKILVLPHDADPQFVQMLAGVEKIVLANTDSVRSSLAASATSDSGISPDAVQRLFSGTIEALPDSLKSLIYYRAISDKLIRAAVEIPSDIGVRIQSGDSVVVRIYSDEADIKSEAAGDRVRDWAVKVRDSIVTERLTSAGLDRRVLRPVVHQFVDVAPPAKKSGFFLGMFLPYMLVILMMTGGMYPALDITAGEKERGTLETLLVAPVSRWHLAIGKFLTVVTAGMVTTALATISMTVSFGIGGMSFGEEGVQGMSIGFSAVTIIWILILMIPTAVLFSSLLIAISIAARSYKEGQSYVTPLLMAAIMPAMVSMVPGLELNAVLAFIPVVNICMAMKEVILGVYQPGMIALVFLSTALYAGFALFVATRLFERESILFRT